MIWTKQVTIDPNVRVRGNHTLAAFEDADEVPSVGEVVRVYVPESGASGVGTVSGINAGKQLIYIAVDWSSVGTVDRFVGAAKDYYDEHYPGMTSAEIVRSDRDNNW